MLKINASHFLNKTKACRNTNYSILEFVILPRTSVPNFKHLPLEASELCSQTWRNATRVCLCSGNGSEWYSFLLQMACLRSTFTGEWEFLWREKCRQQYCSTLGCKGSWCFSKPEWQTSHWNFSEQYCETVGKLKAPLRRFRCQMEHPLLQYDNNRRHNSAGTNAEVCF